MRKRNFLVVCLTAVLLATTACQTFLTGTVTLTRIVDAAAKEYAHAYNAGLVPADLAAKVSERFVIYQQACGVAKTALIAYKATGDTRTFNEALEGARTAALGFVDLVVPFLVKTKPDVVRDEIKKAGAP